MARACGCAHFSHTLPRHTMQTLVQACNKTHNTNLDVCLKSLEICQFARVHADTHTHTHRPPTHKIRTHPHPHTWIFLGRSFDLRRVLCPHLEIDKFVNSHAKFVSAYTHAHAHTLTLTPKHPLIHLEIDKFEQRSCSIRGTLEAFQTTRGRQMEGSSGNYAKRLIFFINRPNRRQVHDAFNSPTRPPKKTFHV